MNMKISVLSILALVLAVAAPAEGATPWEYFGREPFTGSCQVCFDTIPLADPKIGQLLCAEREKVTVSFDDFANDVDGSDLLPPEKAVLKKKAEFYKAGRLFVENMLAIGTSSRLAEEISKRRIDQVQLAKSRIIMPVGDTLDWMVRTDSAGRHKTTERIAVRPAANPFIGVHPELKQQDLSHYVTPEKGVVAYRYEAVTLHYRVLAYEPAVCHNCGLKKYPAGAVRTQRRPAAPDPSLAQSTRTTQRRLVVNFLRDQADESWEKKYLVEDAKWKKALEEGRVEPRTPYRVVFTEAPFPTMLGERKARPLVGEFTVTYLRKEPSLDVRREDTKQVRKEKYFAYLTQLREPSTENVVAKETVTTSSKGYVISILQPLETFEVMVIRPTDLKVSLVDFMLLIRARELVNGPDPAHVWFVRTE